jgi:hypothetical protein
LSSFTHYYGGSIFSLAAHAASFLGTTVQFFSSKLKRKQLSCSALELPPKKQEEQADNQEGDLLVQPELPIRYVFSPCKILIKIRMFRLRPELVDPSSQMGRY